MSRKVHDWLTVHHAMIDLLLYFGLIGIVDFRSE